MWRARGFSLVEVAVWLTVFAIMALLAAPSLANWVANSRVRSVAESLQNSLRLAQTEALRRNRQTVFALTEESPGPVARPAANGSRWYVRALTDLPGAAAQPADYVEGGPQASRNVRIEGPALICFNAVGRQAVNTATGLAANCDAADDVVYAVRGSGAADRRLNVEVSFAGRIRMCDPDRSLARGEPDGC